MCRKPRSRSKRIAWLKRYLRVLQTRLAYGFADATYYPRGRRPRCFPADKQERTCRASIAAVTQELESLA